MHELDRYPEENCLLQVLLFYTMKLRARLLDTEDETPFSPPPIQSPLLVARSSRLSDDLGHIVDLSLRTAEGTKLKGKLDYCSSLEDQSSHQSRSMTKQNNQGERERDGAAYVQSNVPSSSPASGRACPCCYGVVR